MKRVYSVKINGRTLESRNLKELLARAVSVKQNPDRKVMLATQSCGRISTEDISRACAETGMVVVH